MNDNKKPVDSGKNNRRGFQTSDFAAGQDKVPHNPHGGANDGNDTGASNGGFVGTSTYQSGPLAKDPREDTDEAKKKMQAEKDNTKGQQV